MSEIYTFGDLKGKTIKLVTFRKRIVRFAMDNDEEYTLGNDGVKDDYSGDLLGKFIPLTGFPISIAEEIPRENISKKTKKPLNVCSDPLFPFGHYKIEAGNDPFKTVLIRWFSNSNIGNHKEDFFSHLVQFKRIK